MNDQELDILFAQSAQNQKVVEQINASVMRTVRRDMRRKAVRKWARLLGICFGMPLMIVFLVFALMTYLPDQSMPVYITTLALPVITLVLFFGKGLHDFSLSNM